MSWFTDKKTPANLVMLYIEEPDSHGHVYGPDSPVARTLYFCHFRRDIIIFFFIFFLIILDNKYGFKTR